MAAVSAEEILERLATVRGRVAMVGADPDGVELVAVTKGFSAQTVEAAVAAGLQHLGENYAAELITKAHERPELCWHFLGALQRNKTARLAPHVSVWEAIDRLPAAAMVADRAPGAAVLVQVNVTGDPNKRGCAPEATEALVTKCAGLGLDVRGLMTVGPEGDREGARVCFKTLAGLARTLGLRSLSMGMSDDFDIAVGEGATTIRLGRALFGSRPTRAQARR